MKRATPALLVLAFALVGCAPSEGRVTNKTYEPAHTVTTPGRWNPGACYSYNKNGTCKVRGSRTWVPPRVRVQPPTWSLWLVNGEDAGWHQVTEDVWQFCQKGNTYKEGACT